MTMTLVSAHRKTVRGPRELVRHGILIWLFSSVLFVTPLQAHAAFAGQDNLPVYTSPVDVTGLRLDLHAVAPDRNTGAPIEVPLPVGLLGPKMKLLFSTPLSKQIDQYWSVIPDPKNRGLTPRENACKGPKGIIQQVEKAVRQIGSSYGAYDISCDLATTGELVVKQAGSTLSFGYLLKHNRVNFKVATPYTCHAHHGTLACPNDPHFEIRFTSEIASAIYTPDLCHLKADPGTVNTQGVTIDGSNNLTGALAQLVDDLFLGHKFSGAERGIEAAEQQTPLPLDAYFKELRDSDRCTGRNPALHRELAGFRDLVTVIQPFKAITLQLRHVGITPPTIRTADPWSRAQNQPTFTRPLISSSQPTVLAGNSLRITGQYFPAPVNLSNRMPINFSHGGYGANSIVLGEVCYGGFTELQWGVAFAGTRITQIPSDAQGACAKSYDLGNLNPATPYQFRARDCDSITCSPWSSPLKVTTAAGGTDKGNGEVALTIDTAAACNGPWCRSASVSSIGANAAPSASSNPLFRSARGSGVAGNVQPNLRDRALNRLASGPANIPTATGDTPIGSAELTPQGTFVATVTIPPGISGGAQTIRAFSGDAKAELAINVTTPNSGGGRASITLVGLLRGESGCPNHPLNSTVVGANFTLFGAGFNAGGVTIYLDRDNARPLGAATVGQDGTFCQQQPGVPSSQAGAHTLLAVQNGAVLA